MQQCLTLMHGQKAEHTWITAYAHLRVPTYRLEQLWSEQLPVVQDVAENFTEAADQHQARRQRSYLERVFQAAGAHC